MSGIGHKRPRTSEAYFSYLSRSCVDFFTALFVQCGFMAPRDVLVLSRTCRTLRLTLFEKIEFWNGTFRFPPCTDQLQLTQAVCTLPFTGWDFSLCRAEIMTDQVAFSLAFCQGKRVKHLNLKDKWSLTGKTVKVIIQKCRVLLSLDLRGCPDIYDGLGDKLHHNTLEKLRLDKDAGPGFDVGHVVSRMPKLKYLELPTDTQDLNDLPPKLRSLNMTGTDITDLSPLAGMQKLQKLKVEDCKSLCPVRKIQYLELSVNCIKFKFCELPNLMVLKLWTSSIFDIQLIALKHAPNLKKLAFNHCKNITNKGVSLITQVEKLEVSKCRRFYFQKRLFNYLIEFSYMPVYVIPIELDELCTFASLVELSFNHTFTTGLSLKHHIVYRLAETRLTKLDWCSLTKHSFVLLNRISTLRELSIKDCSNLQEKDFACLPINLQKLTLNRCSNCTEAGIRENLYQLTRLTKLIVTGCYN